MNLSPHDGCPASSVSSTAVTPASFFFSLSLFFLRARFFSTSAEDRIRRTETTFSEVSRNRSGKVGWNAILVIGVDEVVGSGSDDSGVTSLDSWKIQECIGHDD